MLLKKGSRTELLGAFWYASFVKKVDEPGIDVEDGAQLTMAVHRQHSFGKGVWPTWVKAVRGSETKIWSRWEVDLL